MRSWAGLAASVCLVGCSSEWVERGVPGEAASPESAPVRTYPMHIPPPGDAVKEPEVRGGLDAVPLGKHAVTLEFPAARARHVEAGDRVDIYGTFDPRRVALEDRQLPAPEPGAVGIQLMMNVEVIARACGEEVCALTMLMDAAEKMGFLAVHAGRDHNHALHAWVHVTEPGEIERPEAKTLREVLNELEAHQDIFDHPDRVKPTEMRRIAIEVEHPSVAVALLKEGMRGEFTGTFVVDKRSELPTRGQARASHGVVTMTLLQRVRMEEARVEGGRVVLELVVPQDSAVALTLARHGAERIDFAVQNQEEETQEVIKFTRKDYLTELEVITSAPRPPRREKARPSRRKKAQPPRIEVGTGE